jgi:hypothetical protein
MRHALSIAIVATLLLGFIDVVAAGSKTVVTKNHFYYATPASGVGIAVPSGITCFRVCAESADHHLRSAFALSVVEF